jgi:hypothetical protein
MLIPVGCRTYRQHCPASPNKNLRCLPSPWPLHSRCPAYPPYPAPYLPPPFWLCLRTPLTRFRFTTSPPHLVPYLPTLPSSPFLPPTPLHTHLRPLPLPALVLLACVSLLPCCRIRAPSSYYPHPFINHAPHTVRPRTSCPGLLHAFDSFFRTFGASFWCPADKLHFTRRWAMAARMHSIVWRVSAWTRATTRSRLGSSQRLPSPRRRRLSPS